MRTLSTNQHIVAAVLGLGLLAFICPVGACGADALGLRSGGGTLHPGGVSTGAGDRFVLTGTFGQHDTGFTEGGRFTLEGGFWPGIAQVQSPGAPLLSIRQGTNGTILISWPVTATGWTLQERGDLSTGTWGISRRSVVDTKSERTVTLPANAPFRCYRLSR